MKKLITVAALLGAVTMSFGQGQLTFNNTAGTVISTNTAPAGNQGVWTGPSTGVSTPALGSYVYALLVAPSTVTSISGLGDANWTFTGAYATNSASAAGGRLTGGQPAIPTVPSGGPASFAVVGWNAALGTTYASLTSWYNNGNVATTGWMGISGVATLNLGGGPSPVPALFGLTTGTQITGFTLQQIDPVPEPSSFALAGLGAAALLIFRRRK